VLFDTSSLAYFVERVTGLPIEAPNQSFLNDYRKMMALVRKAEGIIPAILLATLIGVLLCRRWALALGIVVFALIFVCVGGIVFNAINHVPAVQPVSSVGSSFRIVTPGMRQQTRLEGWMMSALFLLGGGLVVTLVAVLRKLNRKNARPIALIVGALLCHATLAYLRKGFDRAFDLKMPGYLQF
jgi:hypothetical protein